MRSINKNIAAKIILFILGFIFLFSGISKMLDINHFADVLSKYHPRLYVLAPVIIGIELFLGLTFLLQQYNRALVIFTGIFIALLSISFVWAYKFQGVYDCGCFGNVYKISPRVSIIKNALMLLAIGYLLWQKPEKKRIHWGIYALIIPLFGFINFQLFSSYTPLKYMEGSEIKKSFLNKYVSDKTKEQYIFLLKPNCPGCWQATKTINQLVSKDSALSVVGIYPANTPQAMVDKYKTQHLPLFKIFAEKKDSLRLITLSYPKIVKIQSGKILSIKSKIMK